jgi:hypothetical protein
MRVYSNKYRNHWLSPYTILEKVFFWREIDYKEPLIDKWSDRLNPICEALRKVLDVVHPKIDYVKIDYWDTWGMDSTLAPIILPMLKQLKATKHGSPFVDLEDVPEHMRTTGTQEYEEQSVFDFYKEDKSYDDDYSNIHTRWDWVLNEEIWAFEQLVNEDAESQFFDHSACEGDPKHDKWLDELNGGVSKVKYDREGHAAWQARMDNGFRLFGKYFRAHWD